MRGLGIDSELVECMDCGWRGYRYEAKKSQRSLTRRGWYVEVDVETTEICPKCEENELVEVETWA